MVSYSLGSKANVFTVVYKTLHGVAAHLPNNVISIVFPFIYVYISFLTIP